MPRTLWGAGGVSRYRSPVATPQHWLRCGAFPHCFGVHLLHRAGDPHGRRARRAGAARQSLQPAGRACDRRHVVEQARSRLPAHSESGIPIILRAGLRWRSWSMPALAVFACPHTWLGPPREQHAPPWRCPSERRALWHKTALSQTRDVPV